jgi:homoserine kinase
MVKRAVERYFPQEIGERKIMSKLKGQSVVVEVPASTSNLGPGFDCLGLAVQLSNRVEVQSAGELPDDPFLREAADVFAEAAGLKETPGFACTITGEVPRSRGLGSSVTVRLGLLHGLNVLHDGGLSDEAIFALCSRLEGHPDNAAPAAFGGFTICRADGSWQRYEVDPRLQFVLLIPALEVPTEEARKVVPGQFSRADAVWNLSHAAALAAAMASGRYEDLPGCFADRIHQPGRSRLLPFLDSVIAAATAAGALGCWLSGSGSTIAAATLQAPEKVATAMLMACEGEAEVRVVGADNHGKRILAC